MLISPQSAITNSTKCCQVRITEPPHLVFISPQVGINTLDSTNVLVPCGGIAWKRTSLNPHKQFCQNLRHYFFHILLRCCLCNSVFIWAKVLRGQRFIFNAILNRLYHLLFLILPHNCCIVMVVQYVGAIVVVVGR